MPIDIIKMTSEKQNSSYYRVVIDGKVYQLSFPNFAEIRAHFARNQKHLAGHKLPKESLETREELVLGYEKIHVLLGVYDGGYEAKYYILKGPAGFVWENIYFNKSVATDFLTKEVIVYDQSN
ncbi:hypothetical protein AB3G45_12455 [Shinella sp. S4-D37]|uniref:hypothetical protein n=1 Tax=Shinella sp. S4-D37 TaxID=3161999 RepID=UPI00346736B4